MDKVELYNLIDPLVVLLKGYQKTATLKFESMEQKMSITRIYREIYPKVKIDLACDSCVLTALNMILSFAEREKPKYLKSIQKPVEPVKQALKPIAEPAATPMPDIAQKQNKKNGK